jgi:subtilase family serine protease
MARKRRRFLLPRVDRLDDRCLLSGSSLPPGLNPTQLRTAYGINAVDFMLDGVPYSGNGQGQTIAIVDAYHDPYVLSDLKTFDATYGLPDPQFTQITLGNTANTDDGWAGETTLDVEWSHAVAPGAKIVLVEAAIDVARHVPGVSAVSMSFGYPQNDVPGASAFDTYFTTPPGHQGITFIASSGDSGTTGLYGGPSWPAQSPNVLAIGGTTLVVNGPKGYLAESIWNGSGGGFSRYVPEPTYQYKLQTTGQRSIPDVALVADPNTGVAVYTTYPSFGGGGWGVVGGTSLSAPAWAGIMAIVNEGRALKALPSLDGPTETLPNLYALPASDFNKIAVFGPGYGRGYTFGATNLSNTVITTGLGSPAGVSLINDLVTPPAPVPVAPTPPPPPLTTASSPFGPGFGLVVGPLPGQTTGGTTGNHHKKIPPPHHKPIHKPKPIHRPAPVHKQPTHHVATSAAATPAILAAFDAAIPAIEPHQPA